MCGIAGIIDLTGKRQPDPAAVRRMADALCHRGPDDEGFLVRPGFGLASRRLSIIGLGDGRQPIFNEDGTVAVVYNGELFDYPERKAELEAKGHVFRTHTDTEIIVHLYEEYGEDVFAQLKGQFALALCRFHQAHRLSRARPRRHLPAALVAPGRLVVLRLRDQGAAGLRRGAGDRPIRAASITCSRSSPCRAGARCSRASQSLLPGHYLRIAFRGDGRPRRNRRAPLLGLRLPRCRRRAEDRRRQRLVDEFEEKFRRAVEIRLRADVPVVGYLSGGVNSAYVLATASKLRGRPVPSFTIQVPGKGLDETSDALVTARHLGSLPTILTSDAKVISDTYAKLIASADSPVIDTSCAALWCLAQEVHHQGYKVALTGEGSDEAFGGYIWFKLRQLSYWMDVGRLEGQRLDQPRHPQDDGAARRATRKSCGASMTSSARAHAQALIYHLVAQSRDRYFSAGMKEQLGGHVAYEDVPLDVERMRRWSPLNQSLYFGYKVHLAGLLLNHKGDRVAMANCVETRYPFLDEDLIAFTSQLAPRWKLRGVMTGQVHPAPGGRAHAAEGGGVPPQGHVPRAAGGIVLRQSAALRAPAHEPRGALQDRLLRSRHRAARLRSCRLGPGRQAQRLPQDGLERRAVDPALAPPLSGRRAVRAARAVATPAGGAADAAAGRGLNAPNFECRYGEAASGRPACLARADTATDPTGSLPSRRPVQETAGP